MLYLKKKIKKNTWRYHYFTRVYQKSQWYDLQFLRYGVWQIEIVNYGSFFALLMEISSFHKCVPETTIIRGMVPEKQSETYFLSFWAIFCPFTLLTAQKIKILKKWKKNLEMLPFYTHAPQITIIWCMLPEI